MTGTIARGETAFERAFLRLAAGDRAASAEVFGELWPRLLRFCQRAVGPDAEDCAQRAIMTLFEEISTFDPQRSPLAWAYAIAAWECRTLRRKRSRSREVVPETLEAVADENLETALEERDLVRRALVLVESLSELDRETLTHDLFADVAPSAAHRQRRHRMLERLRTAWRTVHGH